MDDARKRDERMGLSPLASRHRHAPFMRVDHRTDSPSPLPTIEPGTRVRGRATFATRVRLARDPQ